MNHLRTQGAWYNLVLADGSHWEIFALDEESKAIVSQAGSAMQLRKTPGVIDPSSHSNLYRLLVQVDTHSCMLIYNVSAGIKK